MVYENEDYYELLPVSPIKKLKKEIEELKKEIKNSSFGISGELTRDIMETIKLNQRIVEDIVKSNAALQTKISEMIIVMNRLIEEINIMSESFKRAAEALTIEAKSERTEDLLAKLLNEITKLINQNQNILDSLTKLEKQLIQRQLQRTPTTPMSQPTNLTTLSPPTPTPPPQPNLQKNPLLKLKKP